MRCVYKHDATHCLLNAALSFVCNQVHCDLELAHCEQVGSTPSHLIFFRLRGEGRTMKGYTSKIEPDTYLQLSHALQTLRLCSCTGLRPISGERGWSSAFFFLDWWFVAGRSLLSTLAVVSVMVGKRQGGLDGNLC